MKTMLNARLLCYLRKSFKVESFHRRCPPSCAGSSAFAVPHLAGVRPRRSNEEDESARRGVWSDRRSYPCACASDQKCGHERLESAGTVAESVTPQCYSSPTAGSPKAAVPAQPRIGTRSAASSRQGGWTRSWQGRR